MQYFLTRDHAGLYEYAKDRSAKDINDMKRKRTWKVHIRNMVYTNDDGMRDIFFQFCFGHDPKLYRIRKTVKGGSKADTNTNGTSGNSTSAVWDWVEKGSRGYMRTSGAL